MSSTCLHGQVLLRPNRVCDRGALEWCADVETPQLFQRLIVIGNDPAILQRSEDNAAGSRQRARAYLDIGDRFCQNLVIDGVEGRDGAVVEVAREGAFLAFPSIDAAVG